MFALFAVQVSHGQWVRYQKHPTMISLETNYGDWIYQYPAVTMCSNYTDANTTIDVVQRYPTVTEKKRRVCNLFVTLHVSDKRDVKN